MTLKVKKISDIVAPVAKITHGGLKSILDEAYKYECIGSSGAAVVDAFTKKFAKVSSLILYLFSHDSCMTTLLFYKRVMLRF